MLKKIIIVITTELWCSTIKNSTLLDIIFPFLTNLSSSLFFVATKSYTILLGFFFCNPLPCFCRYYSQRKPKDTIVISAYFPFISKFTHICTHSIQLSIHVCIQETFTKHLPNAWYWGFSGEQDWEFPYSWILHSW